MERWSELPRGIRWLIATVLVAVAALLFWVTVGVAAFAILRGRTNQPAATGSPTARAATSISNPTASGTIPQATTASPTLASATETATATPSPSSTPPPPTATAVPPTKTNSPVPMADLICLGVDHLGEGFGAEIFRGYFTNGGDASTEVSFEMRWTVERAGTVVEQEVHTGSVVLPGNSSSDQFVDTLSPGVYTVALSLDSSQAVPESNEGNNDCQTTVSLLEITLAPATLGP